MRRALVLVVAATSLLAVAIQRPPPAIAQEPIASLTLVRQTSWITPRRSVLEVEVRARNDGDEPLHDLSLAVVVSDAVRSRSAYDLSLVSDPQVEIKLDTFPLRGELAPGQARSFAADVDLSETIRAQQPLVYPLRIELRSEGVPIGVLRTPLVFLYERPLEPLGLAWWWVLHHPISFTPDGRFLSPSLERSVAPGGHLNGAVNGLVSVTESEDPVPVTVVASPVLLDQLDRMRAGYRVLVEGEDLEVAPGQGGAAAAVQTLEVLGRVARASSVELVALPFAVPSLPSLPASRLGGDVRTQLDVGAAEIERLLEAATTDTIAGPPSSELDEATLAVLTSRGATTILLDPGVLPQSQEDPLGFAPPPTAAIASAEEATVTALLPEPGVQERIGSEIARSDPVLGAQIVLGELATIWLEQPSVPRGLALTIPSDEELPGPFLAAIAREVAAAPWVRPMRAEELAEDFPPPEGVVHAVPTYEGAAFDRWYVTELKEARRLVGTLRSMLTEPSVLPDRFSSMLLLAESREFLGAGQFEGRRFIEHVRGRAQEIVSSVAPVPQQIVTLTSSTGDVPVQVRNAATRPLSVVVELVSPRLRFPEGSSREIEIGEEDVTLSFPVRTETTGRFQVRVVVRSPTGRIVGEDDLIVRSTAYSSVALSIVIGAGLMLVALWARRFLPRRS